MTTNRTGFLAILLLLASVVLPCGTAVSTAQEGPASPESPLAAVRAALESEDFAALSETLEAVGTQQPEAVITLLRQAIEDESTSRQAMAAYALGTFGEKASSAAPELRMLLDAGEPLVRLHAAGALLRVADDPKEALATLGTLLDAEQPGHRRLAASMISTAGEEHGEQTLPLLVKALKDSDGRTRAIAAKGLTVFQANRGPVAVAQWRAAAHEDPAVRRAILPALRPTALREPELVPDLVEIARQGDVEVRIRALRAIGRQENLSRDQIKKVAALLQDENEEVGRETAYALRHLGSRAEPALPELTAALADPALAAPAAAVMRSLGPKAISALPALAKAIRHADYPHTVGGTIARLGRYPGAESEPVVTELIEALAVDKAAVRAAAAKALGTYGPSERAVPALIGRLEDESPEVVSAAASALRFRGPDAAPAVERLAELLDDPRCRSAAAGALGRIGSAAVPHLMKRLDQDDAGIRLRVVGALAQIGVDKQNAVRLRGLLDDESPRVRVSAVRAIWKGTRQFDDRMKAVLSALLDSDDLTERRMALITLDKIGPPAREFAVRISKMLGDENKSVRRDAASALRRIAPEPPTKVPDAIRELLHHEEVTTRLQTLRGLEWYGTAAFPLLAEALRDEHPTVRWAATRKLLSLPPRPASVAADALRPLLKDPEAQVRAAAAYVLWYIELKLRSIERRKPGAIERKPAPLVPVLVGVLQEDASEAGTYQAFLTLQSMGPRAVDAVAVIRKKMPKAQGKLSVHYAAALWAITQDAEAVLPVFERAMQDPDRYVRQRALHELAELGDEAKPLLDDVLRALREEKEGGTRLAAVLVLQALDPTDEILTALKEAADDSDPAVRNYARGVLEELSPPNDSEEAPESKQPAGNATTESRGVDSGGLVMSLCPATYFGGDDGRLTAWIDDHVADQPFGLVVHSPHAGIQVTPAQSTEMGGSLRESVVSVAEDTEPGIYALQARTHDGREASVLLTVADVFIAPEERLNFEGRWVPVADDEVTWSHDRLRYSVQIVPDPFVKPALVEWLTKPSADGNDPVVPWQLLAVGVGGQPAEVGPREPGRYTIGVAVTMIADSFTGSR